MLSTYFVLTHAMKVGRVASPGEIMINYPDPQDEYKRFHDKKWSLVLLLKPKLRLSGEDLYCS